MMPPSKEASTPAPEMVTKEEAALMAKKAAELAAAEAVKSVIAAMAQERGESPAQVAKDPTDNAFAQALAMAIAQIANQGTGKDVVDPAVLEKRAQARKKMIALIVSARDNGYFPEYGLLATVQLQDQLIVPAWVGPDRVAHQTCIKWDGIPNEAMEPKCETARGIYNAFCESIGKTPGTLARLNPVDRKGNIVTPGGHVFESLPQIPKGYEGGDVQVETGALDASFRSTPHNGLEVIGRAPGNMVNREVKISVLGTVADPARQLVA